MPHNYSLSSAASPHVAIIGAGAMGLLHAALLSTAGCRVSVVARRQAAREVINAQGISVEDGRKSRVYKNIAAVPSLAEAPNADLIMLMVKGQDTGAAMAAAAAHIGPEASVFTMQNGMGNAAVIAKYVPKEQIFGGICYTGITFLGDGQVRVAGRGITYLGERSGKLSPRVLALARIFEQAGITASVSDNIVGRIWDKVLVNAGINALAALTCLKNGELAASPEARELMSGIVAEGVEVAARLGVTLEEKDPVAHTLEVARNTGNNIASMLQDVMQGKKTEIENINGMLLARGREVGLELPLNKLITTLLRLLESSYLK